MSRNAIDLFDEADEIAARNRIVAEREQASSQPSTAGAAGSRTLGRCRPPLHQRRTSPVSLFLTKLLSTGGGNDSDSSSSSDGFEVAPASRRDSRPRSAPSTPWFDRTRITSTLTPPGTSTSPVSPNVALRLGIYLQPPPRQALPSIVVSVADVQDHIEKTSGNSSPSGFLGLQDGEIIRVFPDGMPPRVLSVAHFIPRELIQQIYHHLHPADFNSARRVCRLWMNASLDRALLQLMLKRGGWWHSARILIQESTRQLREKSLLVQAEEKETHLLHRALSRECALAGGWTGNGFQVLNTASLLTCDHHRGQMYMHTCESPRLSFSSPVVFAESKHLNFSGMAHGYDAADQAHALRFKASVCGTHLLVAEGSMIYVYELVGDHPRRRTSLLCPRNVRAMAIDVKGGVICIAALLLGRMGMMCTLTQDPSSTTNPELSDSYHCQDRQDVAMTPESDSGYIAAPDDEVVRRQLSLEVPADGTQDVVRDDGTERGRRVAHINQIWNKNTLVYGLQPQGTRPDRSRSLNVTDKTCSIYHEVGSAGDPPISIAVSAESQCLAFGCASGTELTWYDSADGVDLSRWFPSRQRSEHLRFRPTIESCDSLNRVRVIPSLCRPLYLRMKPHRCSIPIIQIVDVDESHDQWEVSHYPPPRVVSREYYNAVPIGDEIHTLFTDAEDDVLCLGDDTTSRHFRRFQRKIIFVPPNRCDSPILYVSTAATPYDFKVVAVYDNNEIIMYSIPSDIMDFLTLEHRATKAERRESETDDELKQRIAAASAWLDWMPTKKHPSRHYRIPHCDFLPTLHAQSLGPIFLHGARVGCLGNVVDLAINHTTGRMAVWAFTREGEAAVWQVLNGKDKGSITHCHVEKDGAVMTPYEVDADGDVQMKDFAFAGADDEEET